MPAPIFVVDSSPAVRRMIEQISSPHGYEVVGFQDGPAALAAARRMAPALIIADYHLADMTFSGFCKEVNKLDHLTETVFIAVVAPSDRLDEQHLRSLGVRAFLTKPLQSDDLLNTIKGLKNGSYQKSAAALKKRAWPPDFTATDLDQSDQVTTDIEGDPSPDPDTPAKEQPPMTPTTSIQTTPVATARTTPPALSSGTPGEDALRALLDYLLQSVVREAEDKIAELVPVILAKELALHLATAVREEVQGQLASALSDERIDAAMQKIIMAELPKHTATQLAAAEHTVKQHVADIAPAVVEQTGERLLRQLVDPGLEKHVPPAVRAHLGPVDSVIRHEVREAVAGCARQTTEEIVREMARERIHEAVQQLVPNIAEAQVKEEIRRLTAPE